MSSARIPDPGFAGDTGEADPVLATAIRAYAGDPGRLPEVLAALHGARVLAPVVAVLGDAGTNPDGLRVDKSADIALPLLLDGESDRDGAGDAARAVPVFSGLAGLARWDPAARPVPVEARRAAAVVLAERADALVLDVAGPLPVTLGLPEVRALLDGRGAVPAYADEELAGLLAQVLAAEPEVLGSSLVPSAGVDARLVVRVTPDADVEALGRRLAARLAALRDHAVRGLDVALTTAG